MRCWERAVRNKTEEEARGKERASLPQEVRERHSGKITQTEGEPAYEEEQVSLPIRGKSEAPPPRRKVGMVLQRLEVHCSCRGLWGPDCHKGLVGTKKFLGL